MTGYRFCSLLSLPCDTIRRFIYEKFRGFAANLDSLMTTRRLFEEVGANFLLLSPDTSAATKCRKITISISKGYQKASLDTTGRLTYPLKVFVVILGRNNGESVWKLLRRARNVVNRRPPPTARAHNSTNNHEDNITGTSVPRDIYLVGLHGY